MGLISRVSSRTYRLMMLRTVIRRFSVEASSLQRALENKLTAAFPGAAVQVQDTSGGCGSAFEIGVQSEQFKWGSDKFKHSVWSTQLSRRNLKTYTQYVSPQKHPK